MTSQTGAGELLVARLKIAAAILAVRPCEAYGLQQDCEAAADLLEQQQQTISALEARIGETRATVIEECAKIADHFGERDNAKSRGARLVAAAIRALTEKDSSNVR